MAKTHYRKVFKSDHLGTADLEDFLEEKKPMIHTIKEVKQEIGVKVAGIKGNHNIAYFTSGIKPLVLNVTNSKVLKEMAGGSSFIEDWKGLTVELYIRADVKMKGEVVGGVRLRPVNKRVLTKDEVVSNIQKADKLAYLLAIKPEIEKYGLELLANQRYKELQNG